jgi:K(+)-stimulated pyrophosphate-energized sodium pump
MMATTAMQLAIDALDQYLIMQVIAEMSELPKEVRTRTDILIPWGIRLQQLERFCYRFSSANFIGITAYVTFTGLTDQYFKAPVLAMLFVGYDTGCFCISDELC